MNEIENERVWGRVNGKIINIDLGLSVDSRYI